MKAAWRAGLIAAMSVGGGCASRPAPITVENRSGRSAMVELYMGMTLGPFGGSPSDRRYRALLADGERWSTRESSGEPPPPPLKMPNGPTLLRVTYLRNGGHAAREVSVVAIEPRERVTVRLGPDVNAMPEVLRDSDGRVIPDAARESKTAWFD